MSVLKFYGLSAQPFGVTPDPAFLYAAPTHQAAMASLEYAIDARLGFSALIAEPGTGKTTLLFNVLEKYRTTATTAFVFETQCDSLGLMRYLLQDLGGDGSSTDPVILHERFHDLVARAANAQRRVIIVIDESQNLTPTVLETVRLLSNFESPRSKLLHIILSGQPQLAELLNRPELQQLTQRITVTARLEPLDYDQTHQYIRHRLRIAGCTRADLFTPAAVELIACESKGVPRIINRICFEALTVGFAMQRQQIGTDVIAESRFGFAGHLSNVQLADQSTYPEKTADVVAPIQGVPVEVDAPSEVGTVSPEPEARVEHVKPRSEHRLVRRSTTGAVAIITAALMVAGWAYFTASRARAVDTKMAQPAPLPTPKVASAQPAWDPGPERGAARVLGHVIRDKTTQPVMLFGDSDRQQNLQGRRPIANQQPKSVLRFNPPIKKPVQPQIEMAAPPDLETSHLAQLPLRLLAPRAPAPGEPVLRPKVIPAPDHATRAASFTASTGAELPAVGGPTISATPVRRVEPDTASFRWNLKTPVTVRLAIVIGRDGEVRKATVAEVSGSLGMLCAQSAVQAIQRWRFNPARRNGVPIESEQVVMFRFGPSEQN